MGNKKIKLLLIRYTVHSSSSRSAVNTSVDRRCNPLLSDRGQLARTKLFKLGIYELQRSDIFHWERQHPAVKLGAPQGTPSEDADRDVGAPSRFEHLKCFPQLQRSSTSKAFCVDPLELRQWFCICYLQRCRSSGAGRMVCFYSPVSVVNMAYFNDTSITFFLRPTLLEREPIEIKPY